MTSAHIVKTSVNVTSNSPSQDLLFFFHLFLLGLVGKFFMPSLVSVPPSSVQTSVHFLTFSVFFQKNYAHIQLSTFPSISMLF